MNPITVLARTLAVAMLLNVAATTAAAQSSRADTVLAGAPKATWIDEGQGRRIVYIFFDPNCPSCALLHRNLRMLIEPQDLQVRWIPVAVVNATSPGKAAAMLQARDRLAALRHNEERYHGESAGGPTQMAGRTNEASRASVSARGPRLDPIGETYSGGIEEDIPTAETEQKLRANERLLNRLDIPVVPSMLFAAKDGRAVLIQGALSPLALRKVFAHLP